MSEPSKTKRKTPSRAKPKSAGSRAPSKKAPTERASQAKATSKKTPAKRTAGKRKSGSASSRAAAPRKPRRAQSRFAPPPVEYTVGDRSALLLMLAPFAVMTLAVGAAQLYTPLDTARTQLALLPEPHAVTASPVISLGSAPRPKPAAPGEAPAPVRTAAHSESEDTIAPEHAIRSLPPAETVEAKPEWLVRADKCAVPKRHAKRMQSTPVSAKSTAAFGRLLARAARAQTEELVIYTDKYQQIGFPMGDVPSFYGVCTDVVIRAYRALGIDLQVLVHKARIGTGDPSIDHRRTKTLRRFFARHGVSLPVTDFPEDYKPGDIVTYYRASGRSSQSHIAIVSDVIAPSGRPMIVHNRGWGPQLEDALFASDVTGHYRFAHTATLDQQEASVPEKAERFAQTPAPGEAQVR